MIIDKEAFFNMENLSISELQLLLEEEKYFNKGILFKSKTSIAKTICKNTFKKYFNTKSNIDEQRYYNTTGYKKDLLLVFKKAHKLIN